MCYKCHRVSCAAIMFYVHVQTAHVSRIVSWAQDYNNVSGGQMESWEGGSIVETRLVLVHPKI